MNREKKVRIYVTGQNLSEISISLTNFIEYAKENKFQHSVDRATPVLEYVEKKRKLIKGDDISLQLSFEDYGTIHDALSDRILFSQDDIQHSFKTVKKIEGELEGKMKKFGITKNELFTRKSSIISDLLKKEHRLPDSSLLEEEKE